MSPMSQTERVCRDRLATMLDLPLDHVQSGTSFASLGLDYAAAVHFVLDIEQQFGVELHPGVTDDYPTLATFAAHLDMLRAG